MDEVEEQIADLARILGEATNESHGCCDPDDERGVEMHRYDAEIHIRALLNNPPLVRALMSLQLFTMLGGN
jgi:hypothetical protein